MQNVTISLHGNHKATVDENVFLQAEKSYKTKRRWTKTN